MIQNVLRDIGGVGIYGVISISLFFVVFVGALVWVCLLRKDVADSIAALPLEDGVRPSPAAATPDHSVIHGPFHAARPFRSSAPGDGRTPPATPPAAAKGDSRHE
jgi:hypothetical protein